MFALLLSRSAFFVLLCFIRCTVCNFLLIISFLFFFYHFTKLLFYWFSNVNSIFFVFGAFSTTFSVILALSSTGRIVASLSLASNAYDSMGSITVGLVFTSLIVLTKSLIIWSPNRIEQKKKLQANRHYTSGDPKIGVISLYICRLDEIKFFNTTLSWRNVILIIPLYASNFSVLKPFLIYNLNIYFEK